MRYLGVTAAGEQVELGMPFCAKLTMDEGNPADSFTGIFPDQDQMLLHSFCIYDGEELIFGGIVDEQKRSISADGRTVEIRARSRAALLLDNEAKPQTYLHPSLGELFQNHGAPYGLQKFEGKESAFNWTYVVRKGVSEWQVFWDFCLYCIGIEPKVTPEGVLDVTGKKPQNVLCFSNDGGMAYTSLIHNRRPKRRLSRLWLQEELGSGYTSQVTDLAAIQEGIYRTRYITAADWEGRRELKEARRLSDELVLVCPGSLCGELGMQAVVKDPSLGVFSNYSVAALEYLLDEQGERCVATLRTDL